VLQQNRPFRFIPSAYVCLITTGIGLTIWAVALSTRVAVAQNSDMPQAKPDVAAPAMLSWQVKDVKDAMTDVVTHKTVSYLDFPNGTSLEASAKCSGLGVEFTLAMYSGDEKPSTLAWKDNTTQVRVRIDGATVRIARVAKEYTNAARLVFYDPDGAKSYMERSVSSSCKKDDIMCGSIAKAQIKVAMDQLQENTPGTLDVLAKAASVRVELALAGGRTNVFDLNPQDQALKGVMRECIGELNHAASVQRDGEIAPSSPFAQPKRMTLQKPITVYLTADAKSSVTMKDEISILGQKQFTNGFTCVVRGKATDGRTITGLIRIDLLASALDESHSKACNMVHGAAE
jgi:hypothetical protein